MRIPEYHETWPLQLLILMLHLQPACTSLHISLLMIQPKEQLSQVSQQIAIDTGHYWTLVQVSSSRIYLSLVGYNFFRDLIQPIITSAFV